MEARPGTVFAGCRIEGLAGRGGMGVVYRARQIGLERPVALKVIAPFLLEDADARERFLRESRTAAAIEHPNILPIYAAGEEDGVAYIVMRLVPGEDLLQRVRRDGPLAPADAAAVIAQVAAALEAAHTAGLVHRDVKPANVLLGPGDHVYLTDFGLARHAISEGGGMTATGRWVGTLDYVAPEQIRGEPADARADIYALGCVLYYALTGRVPFTRETDEARLWAHVHAAPPSPSRDVPGVPVAFDAVVKRALAKQPRHRYRSAAEFRAAVLAAAGDRDGRSSALTRAGRTRMDLPSLPGRPRLALVAAAVAALAAAGAGAAVLLGDEPGERRTALGSQPAPRTVTVVTPPETTSVSAERPRTSEVRVGDRPIALHVGDDSAWVASTAHGRLARVDLRGTRMRVRRGSVVGLGASDLVERRSELWVAVAQAGHVARLRASNGTEVSSPIPVSGQPRSIAAGEGGIWVGAQNGDTGPGQLHQINPVSGAVAGSVTIPEGINDVIVAYGAVWVVGRDESMLVKVDPATRRIIARAPVGPRSLRVAASGGYLWITNHDDDTVARVTPRTAEVVTIRVGGKPYGIAAGAGSVWVACYADHAIVRIDASRARISGSPIDVGLNPIGIQVRMGSVWVTSAGDDKLTRVTLPKRS